ncbi:TPA: hypothetical protein G8N77_004614 [Salmonella enterica]|uniref:Uncharacterized protein n=1 Tax=Salmonella enterica TaxID=28901 RepID=A0A743CYY7_SALER|nr:hypothetical protein [Salmonella enterica subsp. enterica serovar Orion]EFI8237505.1 hypothetical protein [Escherichia coli]HAF1434451.1 hypothetical protein [Salmonella enterica]EDR0542019.1 hypothetical protein [Salmonella enterica subsp. enterica serovar Orion]EDS6179242.1 hypothetical protein [Salmonella enterica subsp. enterica serovar Orion]
MPENPASYRVVRTKSYLFNKADLILQLSKSSIYSTKPLNTTNYKILILNNNHRKPS